MQHGELGFLTFGLVLLAAAVLSVPIARRLGLSAIVAYLIAGIVSVPHGAGGGSVRPRASSGFELGVVMLLFLIWLELESLAGWWRCVAPYSASAPHWR